MEPALSPISGAADLIVRVPAQAELERVLYLFQQVPFSPETRLVAAVRPRPVERFVAALAWWPAGTVACFRLASQPGTNRAGVAGVLVEWLDQVAAQAGLQSLEYADLLPADHEWAGVLCAQGFKRLRSERYFEVPVPGLRARITQLYERYKAEIPAGWRTDPIRLHSPEVILDLIAPHRLLPPPEVRRSWQPNTPHGFDLELSCILFDRERAFGTLLLRNTGELLYVEVQVVQEPNPRLRSLADICLIYHDASRTDPQGPIRRIQFRSGETEHRQTANLALRSGGRELPPRHVFSRSVGGGQKH